MSSSADQLANEAIESALTLICAKLEDSWEPIRLHITDFPIEQSLLTNTPINKEESMQEFCEATLELIERERHPTNISIDGRLPTLWKSQLMILWPQLCMKRR